MPREWGRCQDLVSELRPLRIRDFSQAKADEEVRTSRYQFCGGDRSWFGEWFRDHIRPKGLDEPALADRLDRSNYDLVPLSGEGSESLEGGQSRGWNAQCLMKTEASREPNPQSGEAAWASQGQDPFQVGDPGVGFG